jgi:hypothetical protein
MEVVVFKGEVAVHDSESGDDVAVKKNETFFLDPGDLTRYALEKGAEADALDQFSKDRDDYLNTYASVRSYTQSPYQYGAGDLIYYGQYYDVPGYGYAWQPNGVGVAWDPYSNGYWSYSPGFGYAWVSVYPWGWLPFRYGHWVFVSGRGWCWVPGGWNRWHTGPQWVKVNAPPGFRPPVAPTDRKVVGGTPGPATRPGTGGVGGAGLRGPVGKPSDRDRDRKDSAVVDGAGANRGAHRVLTNDDVQARFPHNELPATQTPVPGHLEPKPAGPAQVERKPAIVDQHQQTEGGAAIHRSDNSRLRGDREPVSAPPVDRAQERAQKEDAKATTSTTAMPPTPSQPVRQNTPPPPQSYSPPPRPPENPSPSAAHQPLPPTPAPVQHYALPAAPPVAAQPRPSSPPPESQSRSSDDSSKGRPR